MPAHPWKNNFTGGEVSPLLRGRTNLQRYQNGAEVLENVIIHPTGGVSRRAGTVFVARTRNNQPARLHRFVFNQSQVYVLEFTSQAIRFYRDRTPIRDADSDPAPDITLSAVDGTITVTTSAGYWDATNDTDIGREIETPDTGRLVITGVTSTTVATAVVIVPFGSTGYVGGGGWTITGAQVEVSTPYSASDIFDLRFAQSADTLWVCHPDHPVKALVRLSDTSWTFNDYGFNPYPSLEYGLSPALTLTLSSETVGTGRTATASGNVFLASDVGRVISGQGGAFAITGYTSATQVSGDVYTAFPDTSLASGEWRLEGSPNTGLSSDIEGPEGAIATITATDPAWRTGDTGKMLHAFGGLAVITNVGSTTVCSARIILPFSSTTDTGGAWTLEDQAWSATFGYPQVVALHDQRLWFAGTNYNPLTVWGSEVGNFPSFAGGPDADNSVVFTLAASELNVIRWMVPTEDLLLGTLGNEFRLHGGDDPITPSNVFCPNVGNEGTQYSVAPVRVNNAVLLLDRCGERLKEFALEPVMQDKGTRPPDLSSIAEHLFRDSLVALDYVRTPDPYILAVSSNGTMMCCAYDRLEQVVGWSRFTTNGDFTYVIVVPSACGDEVWCVAKRTLGGTDYYSVEFFDGQTPVDATSYFDAAAAESLRGLWYLEGATIKAIEDDLRIEDTTVTDGAAPLVVPSNEVYAGLNFSVEIRLLPPEFDLAGTIQAAKKRNVRAMLRLLCTEARYINPADDQDTSGPQSLLVNGEDILLSGDLDEPVTPTQDFTGDVITEAMLGWDRQARITITSAQPVRFTLLAVESAVLVATP